MHACAWGSCHLCNSEPEWEPFPLASDAMRRGRCSALQVQDLNSGRRRGDELQLSREVYAHICKKNNKKKNSDITPNPNGHRPQRPCAQGRTCAEQE